MPDLIEDDGLCTICWEAPAVERERCAECLTWLRRNGRDWKTPPHPSTLMQRSLIAETLRQQEGQAVEVSRRSSTTQNERATPSAVVKRLSG